MLVAVRAVHCGKLLDEISHHIGMGDDSGDADGMIGLRIALDEFEETASVTRRWSRVMCCER
jgi:hypothetical protein